MIPDFFDTLQQFEPSVTGGKSKETDRTLL